MGEPSTSGTSARDLRWALTELCGAEAVEAGLATLPEEDRRIFEAAPARPWVPLRITTRAVDAIAEAAGEEPEGLADRAVRLATERTMTTVWRVLLRFTSNRALLQRTPLIYGRTRNVGRLSVTALEEGSAELVLSEWPRIPPRQARLLAVNMETLLALAGRREVRCHWKRTDDGAIYRVMWRP